MTVHLPTLNAILNSASAVFLAAGYVFIRTKRVTAHKFCMSAAFFTSTVFLASYLYHHYHAGSTKFLGTGGIRTVYFSILISHTILAALIVPLVLVTLTRAWRGRVFEHARIARWTWPLWMYVSVTGVVIYWMLYKRV